MFTTLGLFHKTRCPDRQNCKRPNCIFSHRPDLPQEPALNIPVYVPKQQQQNPQPTSSIPLKRPLDTPAINGSSSYEPPSKAQRVGTTQRPLSVPTASQSSVSPMQFALLGTCSGDRYSQAYPFSKSFPPSQALQFLSARYDLKSEHTESNYPHSI
jgi:hypothetical protein